MPIATNPKTGEVLYLDDGGNWSPAQTAVNPGTKEMLAFDGKGWSPVPQSKGVLNYVDDAVRSIASGITFGWADEFAAKMDEVTGRGGTYKENVAKERAKDASIPIAIKLPGEIAGAVGTTALVVPMGAVQAMARASAGIPQWMQLAAVGVGEGALAGAGAGTEGDRLVPAATGAAVGGVIGAATPAILSGARAIKSAVMPEAVASADIGRALVRDAMTPDTLAAKSAALSAERPGITTLADAGGENIKGLVERIAQTPGAGRTIVNPALSARQAGQLSRISSDLSALTGGTKSAVKATEEVISSRAAAATPLYTAAYNAGDKAIWSPELERLSASPTVRKAMAGAVRTWQDNVIADGYGAMNPGAMVENGSLKLLSGKVPVFPNIQFWDYTKRVIDDQVGTAIKAGQDGKARTLTKLAQALRGELDKAVPEYQTARQAWAGHSAFLNSIEDGRSILSKSISAEEFAANFAKLSRSEQEAYRIGAVSSIVSKMGNDPAELADMTKYLRSPEARAKIAAIMPTPEAAQSWANRLSFEVDSSKLVGKSLGNSATARRLAEAQDAKGIIGDLVLDSFMSGASTLGILKNAVMSGPRWLRDTLRSRTDKRIAELLLDPAHVGRAQALIQARSRLLSSPSTAAPALIGAGVAATQ